MKSGVARVLPGLVLAFAFVSSTGIAQAPAQAPASKASFGSEVSRELADVEKKLVSLAEAMPAEKFSWRPAEGVRSVSEVYVHVAVGNYMLPSLLGTKRPENTGLDMEKRITEKDRVIAGLKASFDHARKAVEAVPDSDLDKSVKFFGQDKTERQMLIRMLNHAHEHLGQSIAYARMNGVAPPWSEGPPPAPEKKPAS
jgi:uncharacterized damage-inducible protein DinB